VKAEGNGTAYTHVLRREGVRSHESQNKQKSRLALAPCGSVDAETHLMSSKVDVAWVEDDIIIGVADALWVGEGQGVAVM